MRAGRLTPDRREYRPHRSAPCAPFPFFKARWSQGCPYCSERIQAGEVCCLDPAANRLVFHGTCLEAHLRATKAAKPKRRKKTP